MIGQLCGFSRGVGRTGLGRWKWFKKKKVPAELAALALRKLQLQRNRLRGPLPDLWALPLCTFNVAANAALSGCAPVPYASTALAGTRVALCESEL